MIERRIFDILPYAETNSCLVSFFSNFALFLLNDFSQIMIVKIGRKNPKKNDSKPSQEEHICHSSLEHLWVFRNDLSVRCEVFKYDPLYSLYNIGDFKLHTILNSPIFVEFVFHFRHYMAFCTNRLTAIARPAHCKTAQC